MASVEPTYWRQNGDIDVSDTDAVRAWIEEASGEAQAKGCVQCRVSIHDEIPGLLLMEGWAEIPQEQGAPRWALTLH